MSSITFALSSTQTVHDLQSQSVAYTDELLTVTRTALGRAHISDRDPDYSDPGLEYYVGSLTSLIIERGRGVGGGVVRSGRALDLRSTTPGRRFSGVDPGQIVHIQVPLSSSSTIW